MKNPRVHPAETHPFMEHLPAQRVGNIQIGNPQAQPVLNHLTTKAEDEFWPLSGKPYFTVVISKSQVKPKYQLIFPAKLHPVLPYANVPAVIKYCDKNWETIFYGESIIKKLDIGWKKFVIDNDLKVGDALVFEIIESSSANLKVRVQILRGDFPAELLSRVNGESSSTPIILD